MSSRGDPYFAEPSEGAPLVFTGALPDQRLDAEEPPEPSDL